MRERFVSANTIPEAYHQALKLLDKDGEIQECSDWNCKQKELSMTMYIEYPLQEPMISKCSIFGPKELEQYRLEMLDGIMDFEVRNGYWPYTYHKRMVEYPIYCNYTSSIKEEEFDQINFVIQELKRSPSSRRAVIDIRDNKIDANSDDPACMQHIQYFIRNNKLDCCVLFRSNDAVKASFMNMFALVLLQKRIADELGVEVGTYTHRANSFHCYEKDFEMLDTYVAAIESGDNLTYDYSNDWKEIMESFDYEIYRNISGLKAH